MENTKNTKVALYAIIAILIIIGIVYALISYQKRQNEYLNYSQTQINQLPEDQRKEVLELQRQDLEKKINNLSSDATAKEKYELLSKLAMVHNSLGMHQEALTDLNTIPEEMRNRTQLWLNYARVFYGMGDREMGKDSIQKALQIADDAPESWRLYIELSSDLPAEQLNALYVEALDKTKNDLDLVISYAKFLEANGDIPKAVAYWETARNKNPDGAADYEKEIARLRPPQQ